VDIISRPHARNLVVFAATRPELIVLSADLTSSCEANDFRDAYPDRFFSFGVAEQNMMGFAAGLAREGFSPYVHTFAVFICRRPYDQVAMSIAYPNLRVRLIGFLPGITTPGGVTHQAIDDIALMRLLPNMTVLGCGDATEVESVLAAAEAVDGPVYVRMLRGEVPRLFDPREPFSLDTARVLSRGTDLAVISEGICTEEALRACRAIERRGVSVSHLHVSTFKPFTDVRVLEACATARHGVISVENHGVTGGLGTALAERLAEVGCTARLVRLGLQDVYAHGASRAYLMREHGLDARAIAAAAERLLDTGLGIEEGELRAIDLAPISGASLPEEL